MPDDDEKDPRTGAGSTADPNQANRTGLPEQSDERPDARPDDSDPEDPTTGPGSTADPNQANRT